MVTISASLQRLYFDRKLVRNLLGAKTAGAMSKGGAYIRRTARTLIGSPAKKSPPRAAGQPVRARSKDKTVTLRNIQFAFDPRKWTTVIGPVGLNKRQSRNGVYTAGTIPQLHESGGTAFIQEKMYVNGRKWVPMGRRKLRPGERYRQRRANYPARPYMLPALQKNIASLPLLWGTGSGGSVFGGTG